MLKAYADNMSKNNPKQPLGSTGKSRAPKHVSTPQQTEQKKTRQLPVLPVPVIAFLLIWAWAAWWQGDVFRMVRENSFFVADDLLMKYELQQEYGVLWCIGRALLMSFRYTWLGGALLAFMLTAGCWLLGYAMRLKAGWRWIQYLPLALYMGIFSYEGLGNFFEAETGQPIGIPFCIFCILMVWGVMIASFSRKPLPAILRRPKDESPRQNYLQLIVIVLCITLPSVWAHIERPYVRPLAAMQVATMEQDWQRVKQIAHENDELNNRPFAAYYAIALVHTGEIAERLFDIRLDYDSIYCPGYIGESEPMGMYLMECDFHAGLAQTAYHHAMENMSMCGPTLRNLKMMTKVALMRSEWELAKKYLTILEKVPFEGDFIKRYKPMMNNPEAVNADQEIARIRLTEPMHDSFENIYVQPVFLGYNATLFEGRSHEALLNSLMVNIYTKKMPEFIFRCQPMRGTTPPCNVAEALTLMSSKDPSLAQQYQGLDLHANRLMSFIEDTRQYIGSPEDRAAHAAELFPKYKGYYPYYYFFGNLKATKKNDSKQNSNAGVN